MVGGQRSCLPDPCTGGSKEKIFTDASLSGWGAEFQGTSTGGQWTVTESKNHINTWKCLRFFWDSGLMHPRRLTYILE